MMSLNDWNVGDAGSTLPGETSTGTAESVEKVEGNIGAGETVGRGGSRLEEDPRTLRDMSRGLIYAGIPWIMMGFMMLVVARVWTTMPLNTSGLFELVGFAMHIDGIRYICSPIFFGIGALVIACGVLYKDRVEESWFRKFSKIVAFLQQPWIFIAMILVAGIWIYLATDPGSDLAAAIASLYGLTGIKDGGVVGSAQEYEFKLIMGAHPIVELMLAGLGGIGLLPFGMYAGAMIFQDQGLVLKKKRLVLPRSFEEKHRFYLANGLVMGGVFYLVTAFALFVIGLAMSLGLNIFYPAFTMANYPQFMYYYPVFPAAFGLACFLVALLLVVKPHSSATRILAWFVGFVQMIIPVYGWFFGINLLFHMHSISKQQDRAIARKERFLGLSAAIFVVLVPLFIGWMLHLDRIFPGLYSFVIDWSDLQKQVNGLVWTFTLILILVYACGCIYMLMESRASEIEVKKKFQLGVGLMFLFIALAQLSVLMYSVFNKQGIKIFPFTIGEPVEMRGDMGYAIVFASISVIYINYCIEKYINDSKKLVLTKILVILMVFGILALLFSYIPAISGEFGDKGHWYHRFGGYIFIGLPGIALILGLVTVPVVYGKLAAQTSGEIKRNAITILVGFIVTLLGTILHVLRDLLEFPFNWVIFIIINIIGLLILMEGYLKSTY